jgi:hypothetical protein
MPNERRPIRYAGRGLAVAAGVLIGVITLAAIVAVVRGSEAAPPTTPSESRTSENAEPATLDGATLRRLNLTREIPRMVHQACAEARRLAEVRIICPKLIPDIPLLKSEGLWGSIVIDEEPRVYMVSFNNAGGFFGRPLVGVEHWITGGGKAPLVEKWILTDFVHEVEGDAKLVRSLERDGRLVRIYRFPHYPGGGVNGDHWAAFVRIGNELVFASLHDKRYVGAAIAMALDLARQAET